MPTPGDRLRSGQEARTATGSLATLRAPVPNVPSESVSGSFLPPPTHTFSSAEFFTGDTFYGPGGAYIYTFPFIDSSVDGVGHDILPPAEATRWGLAQYFWMFRDNQLPTSAFNPDLPQTGYEFVSWWKAADDSTYTYPAYGNGNFHDWGQGAANVVYVVVEVDDDHPAPEDPTIDLTELIALLQSLIAPPIVFDMRPTGMSDYEALTLGNRSYIPAAGCPMTIKGFQITDPVTITVDGVEATDVVIHTYESDAHHYGFADQPGRVTCVFPPHEPAPDDDTYVDVVLTCSNGTNVGTLTVQYVDPAQYTQLDSISPNRLSDTGGTSEFVLTGTNFEENGFWIAFSTDTQTFAGPFNAPVGFGSAFTSSITATEVHLPYPFTDGDTTYTLQPGTVYHVSVGGYYYRFADTVLRLTTGGTAEPDALYADGDQGTPTDVDNDGPISVGTALVFKTYGSVTGLQYFLPTAPTGSYTGALYQISAPDTDPAGTLLGTCTFDITGASAQWITADFDAPIWVSPETEAMYRAVVYSDDGAISRRDQQFVGGVSHSAHGYVIAYNTEYTQPGLGLIYNGTYHSGTDLTYPTDADDHDYGVTVHGGDGYLIGVTFQPAGTADKISSLLENFGDPAVNTGLWTITSGEPSQDLSILTLPAGASLTSVNQYDFTGSSIVLGVPHQTDVTGRCGINIGFGDGHWLWFAAVGTTAKTGSDLYDEIDTDGADAELRWIRLTFADDGTLTVAVGANGFDDFTTVGHPYPITDDLTSTHLFLYADDSGPTNYLDQIGPND